MIKFYYGDIEKYEEVDSKGLTPADVQRAIDQYIATQSQYKEDADMYREMFYMVAKQRDDIEKDLEWYKNRYENINDRKEFIL